MQNLKYKAVALDLDGTLTDSDKKLPLKNKEALWKAMDLGVQVILISGRS
ncbi:MAG: HAD hydrolase family protein, partial [Lachnospiraceae bacterium]|nr:HAD hydrolase family protein [Lachnospiraceae bacterium]